MLHDSVERTGEGLGRDEAAYQQLFDPLVKSWPKIADAVLGPLRWPRHPLALARFGLRALQPATSLVRRRFSDVQARALFAGVAAHSMLPLETRRPAASRSRSHSQLTLLAGASREVARSVWPTRSRGTYSCSAARLSRSTPSGRSTSCRRPGLFSVIYRRGRCFRSPDTDFRSLLCRTHALSVWHGCLQS
jgi:hypothetical protein